MSHRAALVVMVALLAACSSGAVERMLEEDALWEPRTVLASGRLTLHSPYARALSAIWADTLDREIDRVGVLFGLDATEPQLVRLVPAPLPPSTGRAELDLLRAGATARHNVSGYARHGGEGADIVLYVPEDAESGAFALLRKSDVLRHELSHVLCRRVGLADLPRWLDDGLAEVVAFVEQDDDGVARWEALTPMPVHRVRERAPAGALERLLAWGHVGDELPDDPAASRLHYDLAHALALFHMRRATGSFVERARSVAALDDDALRALGPEWRDWLTTLDPVAEAEAAARSNDPDLRRDAFQRLCVLVADLEMEAAVTPALAGLAVAALGDRHLFEPASRYLTLGGHRPLSDDTMAALGRAEDPAVRLAAQAVRVRRGEPADAEAVAGAWKAAVAADRTRDRDLAWIAVLLDLDHERQDIDATVDPIPEAGGDG